MPAMAAVAENNVYLNVVYSFSWVEDCRLATKLNGDVTPRLVSSCLVSSRLDDSMSSPQCVAYPI
jgi:hypothetical protein